MTAQPGTLRRTDFMISSFLQRGTFMLAIVVRFTIAE